MRVTGAGREAGLGEFGFLERLRRTLEGSAKPGELHVGDDAAVLLGPVGKTLFATDLVVEGVHFDLALGSVADAGWKAVAANVSDVAAMGGAATHAVLGVAAPKGTDLDQLFEGMRAAAEHYGLALVGGDLSSSSELVIAVAILGDSGDVEPVLRSGAAAGDEIWCTGPLGASAAGLEQLRAPGRGAPEPGGGEEAAVLAARLVHAYLRPEARPLEGRKAAELGATAMIDVSDGLSQDLGHLATESGVGVSLTTVPVADGATEEQALGGGEDYELVFAAPPARAITEGFAAAGLRPPVKIGLCVGDPSVRELRGGPLPEAGWVHDLEGPDG